MSETMASSGVDYFFGATTRYNVRRHIGKLECKMQIKRQRTCENRQMNKNIKETISTTLLSPTPVLQSSIHLYPALEIWTPCASRCWPGCALSWCTHNVDKYICQRSSSHSLPSHFKDIFSTISQVLSGSLVFCPSSGD